MRAANDAKAPNFRKNVGFPQCEFNDCPLRGLVVGVFALPADKAQGRPPHRVFVKQ